MAASKCSHKLFSPILPFKHERDNSTSVYSVLFRIFTSFLFTFLLLVNNG